MRYNQISPEVGVGTLGGSISSLLVVNSSPAFLQLVIGATIGTVISFSVSLVLKFVVKKIVLSIHKFRNKNK